MELFDLEIPIRTTGGAQARADFKGLEQSATRTSATVEQGQKRTESASLRVTRAIMQQEAQQRANAKAAADMARALESGMARVRTDVERASAAFKAGTISARDYKTALQFARVEAQQLAGTAGSLSGTALRNMNAVMAATTVTTKGMGTGLATIRTGLASMAATAIGASGALGSMGAAMLTFAAGTGPALAVAAAIAGIVLAFRALTARSREQKKVTDELRESFKQLNDEMNRGPGAQQAAEAGAQDAMRRRLAVLQQRLSDAEAQPAGFDPDERQARRVVLERLRSQVATLQQELRASEALTGSADAERGVKDAERRRAALIALVAAGKASVEQERELRDELAKTRTALAELTPQYLATANGIERQAELTERLASIEAAFEGKRKERTREGRSAVDLAADEVALLVEMGREFGVTAKTVDGLRDAIAKLERMQAAANVTDQDALKLMRARTAALTELTRLTSASIPQTPATFGRPQSFVPQGGDDPFAGNQRFGAEDAPTIGFGDMTAPGRTLGQSFTDGIAAGIREGTATVEGAVQGVSDALIDAAAAREVEIQERADMLGSTLSSGIANAIASAASGGNIVAALGGMVKQFGVAVIMTGKLMAAAMKALASLNPIAAIAAGAALVALGSVLQGAAGDSFGGGRSAAGSAGLQPITTTYRVPSSNLTQAPARESANTGTIPKATPPLVVNYLGDKSPTFDRFIRESYTRATNRGVG